MRTIVFVLWLVACGRSEPPPPDRPARRDPAPGRVESPAPAPSASVATPAPELPDDGDDDGNLPVEGAPSTGGATAAVPTGVTSPSATSTAPSGTCVVVDPPLRVWAAPAPPALVTDAGAALVAGYTVDGGHDVVFVAEWSPGRPPAPLRRIALAGNAPADRRTAPPSLLALGDRRIVLAHAEASGRLALREIRRGDPVGAGERTVTVGQGADLRFAPALARIGDHIAVAWTDGRATPMRLRLAILDAALAPSGPERDVTPVSMGAAAPSFVVGAVPPLLLFIDPRRGISPIHRLALGADGPVGESRVIVSTGVAPDRPVVAGALAGDRPLVAWSVIGRAATTAVGLARLDSAWTAYARPPEPLVPGTAYTPLSVSTVRLEQAHAVFATDQPTAATPTPSGAAIREAAVQIGVRVVAADGALRAPLTVAGPDGTARGAALASFGGRRVALSFRDGGGTYVSRLDCAP
ncbi:MAG: hypothetical protein IT379_30740 [Deltaproteobacteria bacterium]|nr:hypothetical protein [Deltaproteobacteria bacterium]